MDNFSDNQHNYSGYENFMSQNNNRFEDFNPFEFQDMQGHYTNAGPSYTNVGPNYTNAGPSYTNEPRADFNSNSRYSHEPADNEVAKSNAIYNLSGADDFISCQDTDSGETDNDDLDDSDSSSTDNEERDNIHESARVDVEGHIPTAPWFTTEEITNNNVTDNSGDFPNFNPLSDDLFEGKCFADKESVIDAIKASHISDSRNYRVLKSTTTLFEAKCVVAECPWRIRVIKKKRCGYFEITKLPVVHNCLLRTIQRDHKKLSSRLIANTIKQQVRLSINCLMNSSFFIGLLVTILYFHILGHGKSIHKSQ